MNELKGLLNMQEIIDRITSNRTAYLKAFAAIRDDDRLTPAAKSTDAYDLWREHQDRHEALFSQYKQAVESERDELTRRAFRASRTGRPEELADFRHAVGSIGEEDKLGPLMERAKATSDTTMLRAVGLIARERGDWQTLNALSADDGYVSDLLDFERQWGDLRTPDRKFFLKTATTGCHWPGI